jgi:hypothetical protein
MEGLQLIAAISVVGAIALAIFAALTLRNVRPGSAPPASATAESVEPAAMAGRA